MAGHPGLYKGEGGAKGRTPEMLEIWAGYKKELEGPCTLCYAIFDLSVFFPVVRMIYIKLKWQKNQIPYFLALKNCNGQ
jgi:hypothetical protein